MLSMALRYNLHYLNTKEINANGGKKLPRGALLSAVKG